LLWGGWVFCTALFLLFGGCGLARGDDVVCCGCCLFWMLPLMIFLIFLSAFIHADRTCVRNFRCCTANYLKPKDYGKKQKKQYKRDMKFYTEYCDEIPHGGGWSKNKWRGDDQRTFYVPKDEKFLSHYVEEAATWRNHKCFPDASCTDHMVPVHRGYLMTTMDMDCDWIWGCSCAGEYRLQYWETPSYERCESLCGTTHQCNVFSFDGEVCNTYSRCEEAPGGHSQEVYYKRTDFPTCLDVYEETASEMCSEAEIWETVEAEDVNHCKALCNARNLCQYVTYHDISAFNGNCFMFQTCDVTTPTSSPATIFHKRFYRYDPDHDPSTNTTTSTSESPWTTTSGDSVANSSTTEAPHYEWDTCEVVDDPWPDHRRELEGSEYPVVDAPQPIRRNLGGSGQLAKRLLETMGTMGSVWTPVDIAWTMFDMWQTLMGGESDDLLSPECATDAAIQCFNWMSCAECVLSYAELEVTDYHEFSKTGQDSCSRWYDRIALYKNTPSCFANSCEGACPGKFCSENACWYYYENCKDQLGSSSHLTLSIAFFLGLLMIL